MRRLGLLLVGFVLLSPAVASAGKGSPTCADTDITPTAMTCLVVGGNVNDNSKASVTAQQTELGDLGLTWDGKDWNQFDSFGVSGDSVTFDEAMYGTTYIALHFGGGSPDGNSTVFYKFDAGETGITTIDVNIKALSNAILYSTQEAPPPPSLGNPVPEPASWALMLIGFGGLGAMARSRRGRRAAKA